MSVCVCGGVVCVCLYVGVYVGMGMWVSGWVGDGWMDEYESEYECVPVLGPMKWYFVKQEMYLWNMKIVFY